MAELPPSATQADLDLDESQRNTNRTDVQKHLSDIMDQNVWPCGKGTIVGRHRDTGRVFIIPACCHKWTCPRCAPHLSNHWAEKAADACPQRFITITVDPKLHKSPQAAKEKLAEAFKRFVQFWRSGRTNKHGKSTIPPHTFEYMAVYELQQNGMPHMHILQKGDYVPQLFLKRWMDKAQVGSIADIRKIRTSYAAAKYVVKYTQKTAAKTVKAFPHQRMITASRHFFNNTTDPATVAADPKVDWIFTPRGAIESVGIVARGLGYHFIKDRFPFVVELEPGEDDLDINTLDFYLEIDNSDPP